MALFGAAVAVYELITWSRWLAAGPRQVTEYRDTHDASWTVARFYEALILVVAVVLLVKVVRECRERRKLTLDAQLLIGGVAALFFDPLGNFVQPAFFYSSNWLNLNSWTGFAPLVINPDASRMPEPVFIMLVYPFGLLAFAMLITAFLRRLRRARPTWSTARTVIAGSLFATVCGMALEAPMFLLHLWNLPGAPRTLSLFDNAHRYSPVEFLTTGMVFAGWGIVRYLKDDHGRAFTQRGMSTGGSVLALIGWCASLMMILCLIIGFFSFHASPYPRQFPRHLVNGMCDVGATQNTRYGPCPGSPGFRMPTTLPGKAPFS
jgi:cytochrome c oxidase assembly factor CtaG